MARLSQLVPGFAEALKVPEKSVRHAASVLRLNKLLTTGPRGPGAPHMTPRDATNLLLAIMYDDEYEAAKVNVPRIREAELTSFKGKLDDGSASSRALPPHAFLSEGGAALRLGDVLDRIFEQLSLTGNLDVETDPGTAPEDMMTVDGMAFSLSRPGYASRLFIDTDTASWALAYTWIDPADLSRRKAQVARGETPTHYLTTLRTFLTSTRSVEMGELTTLAECLGSGRDAVDATDGAVERLDQVA